MIGRFSTLALLATTSLALAQPALSATSAAVVATATQAMSQSQAHDALFALFKKSDEDNLKRNPLSALSRGDLRYADQLGNYLTKEYNDAEIAAAKAELAALRSIPRDALSPTDKIAYDVFEYGNVQTLKGFEPAILSLTEVRPVNHFSGFHTFYPTFASGKSAAPFKTVLDYENNLKRHRQYAAITDRAIGKFREGMASGVLETKLTIKNVIEQLDTQLKQPVEQSPFYGPIGMFPETISAADRARLTAEYKDVIGNVIYPAHKRLRDFLANE